MATISSVQICNMALSHIGQGRIESLAEASPQAKQCKLWYDISREETLEAFDWSFARKRITLSADSEDPPESWAYRYQYPVCLTIRRLAHPSGEDYDPPPYTIELNDDGTRKTILTDLEDAVAVVTLSVTDPNLFTKHFAKTVARKLAGNIAYALTAKSEVEQTQTQWWTFYIHQAPSQNAREEGQRPVREASWIEARS